MLAVGKVSAGMGTVVGVSIAGLYCVLSILFCNYLRKEVTAYAFQMAKEVLVCRQCYFSCDFLVIVIVKVIIFQVFQLEF